MLRGYTVMVDIEDGDLYIDDNSEVSSNGFVAKSTGTHSEFGASYGGIGGCCQDLLDHLDYTYGSYDAVVNKTSLNVILFKGFDSVIIGYEGHA